jgi:predicted ATP-grasp superfamily ATP-dependent carboligase
MRILVHEYASGGGLAGRPVPRSLAREGSAMLAALVTDLTAIPGLQVVTTSDPRFPLQAPASVEVVTLPDSSPRPFFRNLDPLISTADAVWLIAPESDRCLERLAARVERKGVRLLGSSAAAIRAASDKARLARILRRHGVPHPATRDLVLESPNRLWNSKLKSIAREIDYPIVTKPIRGAGCEGVWLVRSSRELHRAVQTFRGCPGKEHLLLQEYVPGMAASVSLLADGRRAVALAVNSQCMRPGRPFSYEGGVTPLDHPLAAEAAEAAVRACEAVPGLRGYIGVDVMLTASGAVVIEVNPRLTTAYLGVRRALQENVAEMAIAACAGTLPAPPVPRQSIRFASDGQVLS